MRFPKVPAVSPFVTVAEVAETLRVSKGAVYERVRRHEIPALHGIGRSVRIPREWLDELVAATRIDNPVP